MDIDSRGPVLVTGAGSGIGLATVRALLAAGHPVYAGARRQVHRDMLQALGAVPLTLDVRDADQVQRAAEAIADVVLRALTVAQPQPRYLVGTRWEGERVIRALTERLIDAARSPSQGWDEAAFIEHCLKAWRDR